MSAEDPITAEQVMQIATIRLATAERIATYANHRAAGLRPTDARQQLDITDVTGSKYERVTREVRVGLGLPPLTAHTTTALPDFAQRGESGRHSRWHVGRGVTDPGCELCDGGPS